jgi:hypothetical protein
VRVPGLQKVGKNKLLVNNTFRDKTNCIIKAVKDKKDKMTKRLTDFLVAVAAAV